MLSMRFKQGFSLQHKLLKTAPLKLVLSIGIMSGGIADSPPSQQNTNENHHAIQTVTKHNINIPIKEAAGKSSNILLDAPFIKQNPELPRGCEVTSLAMLLNHSGISVDKMTLAHQVKKVPFEKNGFRGNMNDGFVGNMQTMAKPGIGVYHGPIKDLAEMYFPGTAIDFNGDVVDFTGKDFNEVIHHLNQKRPVWVLVTSTFNIVPKNKWHTWKTKNGPLKITYRMHSVLVTGYDNHYIYVNDPLASKNRRLPRQQFIAGWEQMGRQAITIVK